MSVASATAAAPASSPPPPPPSGATTRLAESFKRLVLDDLRAEWERVEELQAAIAQKRELAVIKTRQAQELLSAVSGLHHEVGALEAQLSEAFTIVMQKRQSSEAALLELVRQWEREKVSDVAAHDSTLRQSHDEQLRQLTRRVSALTDSLEEKDRLLEAERHEVKLQQQLLQEAHADRTSMERRMELMMLEQRRPGGGASSARKSDVDSGAAASSSSSWAAGAHQRREGSAAFDLSTGSISASEASRIAALEAQVAALMAAGKVKDSAMTALREQLTTRESGSGGGRSASASTATSATTTQQHYQYHHHQQQQRADEERSGTSRSPSHPHAPQQSPGSTTRQLLGLELSGRRQQQGLPGVHILDVLPGGPADEAGLRVGEEVIVGWGGVPVSSLEDVQAASQRIEPESFLAIELARPPPPGSAADARELVFSRKVHLLVAGRVGPLHHRTQRFAVGGVTASATSPSAKNRGGESGGGQQGHAMTRAELLERFMREH